MKMNVYINDTTGPDIAILRHKCALSDVRKLVGMTQCEMAKRLNVSQPAYASFEKGSNLRVGTLQRIASALGGELSLNIKLYGNDLKLNLADVKV